MEARQYPRKFGVKAPGNALFLTLLILLVFSRFQHLRAEPESPEPPLRTVINLENLPLAGKRIALSAGHGIYQKADGTWSLQRGELWGLNEDTVNAELVMLLGSELRALGATIVYLREPDKTTGSGASGWPRWQEASRHYLQGLGLPSTVWDTSNCSEHSTPILCKDWYSRPLGANYLGADIMLSIHNNAGGGTGTETFYSGSGEYHSAVEAQRLAADVQTRLVASIRSDYDNTWVDRGVKLGSYVEVRYAAMPAILTELAFLDREAPDNAAMHDAAFREIAIKGIALGVCDYFGVVCEETSSVAFVVNPPDLFPAYNNDTCVSGWLPITGYAGQPGYLTVNTNSAPASTNAATWRANLPQAGYYSLAAYIANHAPVDWPCRSLHFDWDTSDARYTVYTDQGPEKISADQAPLANQWLELGQFSFAAGETDRVGLSDLNDELDLSKTISFSAMRFALLPPEVPRNVEASIDIYSDRIAVAWSAAFGARSYNVYRAVLSSNEKEHVGTTVDWQWTDTTAVPGVDYSYWITAANPAGESSFGSPVAGRRAAASAEPHFLNCVSGTGNNATIAVTTNTVVTGILERLDEGDEVAVFAQNKTLCVGSLTWNGQNAALTVWGDDSQTPEVDGLVPGEALELRIWDRSEAIEFDYVDSAFLHGENTYQSNAIYVLSTLDVKAHIVLQIHLAAGWNMISSYVQMEDMGLSNYLGGTGSGLFLMKNIAGQVYWPSLGIDAIGKWDPLTGYQVYMLGPATLSLEGSKVPTQTPIPMATGWNAVSFLNPNPQPVDESMLSLLDSLVLVKNGNGSVYWPSLGINTLLELQPGEGYLLYLSSANTLIYP